jgi:hypothetical protein
MNIINNGRINVALVPELYKSLGMTVKVRQFGCTIYGNNCGCLITALLVNEVGAIRADKLLDNGFGPYAAKQLGINLNYARGLIDGFDRTFVCSPDKKTLAGRADGEAAYKLLDEQGLISAAVRAIRAS